MHRIVVTWSFFIRFDLKDRFEFEGKPILFVLY